MEANSEKVVVRSTRVINCSARRRWREDRATNHAACVRGPNAQRAMARRLARRPWLAGSNVCGCLRTGGLGSFFERAQTEPQSTDWDRAPCVLNHYTTDWVGGVGLPSGRPIDVQYSVTPSVKHTAVRNSRNTERLLPPSLLIRTSLHLSAGAPHPPTGRTQRRASGEAWRWARMRAA